MIVFCCIYLILQIYFVSSQQNSKNSSYVFHVKTKETAVSAGI